MIKANEGMNVALIGTYPPRRCGIATFTHDLASSLRGSGTVRTPILAVTSTTECHAYAPRVEFQIRQGIKSDYLHAAEFLNYSDVSIVSIQHEYGIYGGADGAFILDLIAHLTKPFVVTLHTVLDSPSASQRDIVRTMVQQGGGLVVMSDKAIELLTSIYGIDAGAISVIPHGIPDIPQGERDTQKAQLGLANNRAILTFGLLSAGKGIETGIRALPDIVRRFPDTRYLVVGATHPDVRKREGERYRHALEDLASSLGVRQSLVFRNAFVELDELIRYLQASDILLTPYANKKQITSGVLAYAMGAGAAPVSTPYWHAQELLADGRGRLFPFGDSAALASTITELFENVEALDLVRTAAYEYSRGMTWGSVGTAYNDLLGRRIGSHRPSAEVAPRELSLPELRLDHLQDLTDDTGVIQHARYTIPRRESGYCVDDNARALVVALHAHELDPSERSRRMITTYLAFLEHAQTESGGFENFMAYDRSAIQAIQSQDSVGRALWSLGEACLMAPNEGQRRLATELFNRSMSQPLEFGPRGAALSILGIDAYLQAHPGHEVASAMLDCLGKKLVEQYDREATDDWNWFEPTMTYDNGMLPLSLFKAYARIQTPAFLRVARQSLGFLEQVCFESEQLRLVGNSGWHNKGGERSLSDEQPLDAASLSLAFKNAYLATGNARYLQRMRQSFEWFLGKNRLGIPLYDFTTGGCRDGLGLQDANENQGAESTLSFLTALLAMLDVVSEMPGHEGPRQVMHKGRGVLVPGPVQTRGVRIRATQPAPSTAPPSDS